MITIENLSHAIAGHKILTNVNTHLPHNKITALIGPNGAGKSTLLNAIGRQFDATAGDIYIDGAALKNIDLQDQARRLATVAQHLHVGSRIRVIDLIGFGRWPHAKGRLVQADYAAIDAALELFDLVELSGRFLDELSGGQRQRAFIAMAHAQDTDWLLLDEPLNNLDLKHGRSLMAHLRHLVDAQNRSVVVVLHDLNFTLAWADHIVAMRDGTIVFDGPTAEVATSEALSDLYQTPIEIVPMGGHYFAHYHR
ncbi:ATP-binding cassette domain-containing protein [Shimia sp. R9_1]|uniref:iron ABC transporter ATP-binding protein n=1 Tax=Shimia sp. R9_1 TaxID=2821111 RepID=UPI001AD96E4F|nr:ATP-binding cassette domain-containing protein [Shimia sp. R9_1]MBO9409606.1 ATP-binding cassette domain-containing protein [Shimia sp. R9_1]